jgi:hypothetical protein
MFVFVPDMEAPPDAGRMTLAAPEPDENLGGLGTALREVFAESAVPILRELRAATRLPGRRISGDGLILASGSALFIALLLLTNLPTRVTEPDGAAVVDPPLLVGFDVPLATDALPVAGAQVPAERDAPRADPPPPVRESPPAARTTPAQAPPPARTTAPARVAASPVRAEPARPSPPRTPTPRPATAASSLAAGASPAPVSSRPPSRTVVPDEPPLAAPPLPEAETTFAAASAPPAPVPSTAAASPPAPVAVPAPGAEPETAPTPAPRTASRPVEREIAGLAGRPRSAAVQSVLNQYRDAFNALDPAAARAVWPSVDSAALSRAFGQLEEQAFRYDRCDIRVFGERAEASCGGTLRYVPKVGGRQARVEQRRWEFSLREVGDEWSIERVVTR